MIVIVGWACTILPGLARGQSHVSGWGLRVFDSRFNLESFVEVVAGDNHTVARRSDGSLAAWGINGQEQCNVPRAPGGLTYVEVAAGALHTVARRSDGS